MNNVVFFRAFLVRKFIFLHSAEQEKNDFAVTIMNRVLDNAHWINIHTLPVSDQLHVLVPTH